MSIPDQSAHQSASQISSQNATSSASLNAGRGTSRGANQSEGQSTSQCAAPYADPSAGQSATQSPTSNPTRRFDTFIFDLDGTLLHTLPDLVVITNMALREAGYPERSEAEILSYVGNGVRALMYQAVPEGTPDEDAEAAMKRWKSLFPRYDNNLTRPYPHILEMIEGLRNQGCKLGVLSNKFEPGVHQVMDKCLPGLFDVEHGESERIPRKPDPTGLLLTINELGSTPTRAVYVGDSPGDVRAARNAGVFAVGVSWGYHKPEDFANEQAEPDLMISSPLELIALARPYLTSSNLTSSNSA